MTDPFESLLLISCRVSRCLCVSVASAQMPAARRDYLTSGGLKKIEIYALVVLVSTRKSSFSPLGATSTSISSPFANSPIRIFSDNGSSMNF
jgi:hypothetical protein